VSTAPSTVTGRLLRPGFDSSQYFHLLARKHLNILRAAVYSDLVLLGSQIALRVKSWLGCDDDEVFNAGVEFGDSVHCWHRFTV
jgi:hypothetical protein